MFNYAFQCVQDLIVDVLDLNGVANDKLAKAISLTYDKVNARISVSILFPEPICSKASISFKGCKIPNGDFDIIVLSSESSFQLQVQ